MSLTRARQLLEMRPELDNPYYAKIMAAQTSLIASVLSTQTKTDETMLRAKTDNKMERLIQLVQEQRQKIIEAKPASPKPSVNWTEEVDPPLETSEGPPQPLQ